MRLLLASNNAKKLAELRELLAPLGVALQAQAELGLAEAEEPHATFVENALAKARHAARAGGGAALADDSGVCVDALGGEPGVVSAHYAGPVDAPADIDREALRRLQDAANNARLLQRLHGVPDGAGRRAHFVCTLVALRHADDPQPLVAVGRWPGEILTAPRGTQGFGYDPLMFIPALGRTVAEMDAALKNAHSHRSRAIAALLPMLREVWGL
jgi:XTP/dITP diphosphohydrolase